MPDSAPRYTSRAEKKHQNRLAFVNAARDLLEEQDLRSTTMEAIADRAGLHVQTLYKHFDNKAALLMALEEEIFESQRKILEDPGRKASTIEARLQMDLKAIKGHDVDTMIKTFKDPEFAGVHMLVANRYIDLLSTHLAVEMGMDARDPEPRLIASMLHWGSFSVTGSLAAVEGVSNAKLVRQYRKTFKLIAETLDMFVARRKKK
ncbi:MAG: helix-turn-helix domain containing protein [Gammaproteobacteria bacterium]|nr:helix-turn-helix domain containing protein [Gammaproteobacteria bacterium]